MSRSSCIEAEKSWGRGYQWSQETAETSDIESCLSPNIVSAYILIVYLGLDPVHQEGDVLGRGEVGGLLIFGPVLPQILKL